MAKKNQTLSDLKNKGQLTGMRLTELEKVIGAPTTVNEKSVIYRNDNGLTGAIWTLEVTDGVITAVQEQGLE